VRRGGCAGRARDLEVHENVLRKWVKELAVHCYPTLDRPGLEFFPWSGSGGLVAPVKFASMIVIRHHSLDHRRLEIPGDGHGHGLGASPGFISVIGGLLPIAPCGRSSLVSAPLLQLFAGFCNRQEPVGVQALCPEAPVESFDVGVIGGLARPAEV